ncbi:hypothetical protein BZA70DRAFT_10212 [Myxozyma melibiosi]|uniref:Uncharacterized protein n=1 Tax=Myxozyma melibiosi TaxID=54550 RepID=A0ABR1FE59_9ASCO
MAIIPKPSFFLPRGIVVGGLYSGRYYASGSGGVLLHTARAFSQSCAVRSDKKPSSTSRKPPHLRGGSNVGNMKLGSEFAKKKAEAPAVNAEQGVPLHVPGLTDEKGFGIIKTKKDLEKLLKSVEGKEVVINDPDNVLGLPKHLLEKVAAPTAEETKEPARAPGAAGGGGDIIVDTTVEEKDQKKAHMGYLPAVVFISLMAVVQAVSIYQPEIWKSACTVSLPSAPTGTPITIDLRVLLTSAFSAPSFSDWVINSYVGFFSIRALSMIFGNLTGFGFIAVYLTYANRALLYEASRTHPKYVEETDDEGNPVERIRQVTQAVEGVTSNTTLVFSLAAFAGCMMPHVMLPVLPSIGPLPLLSLSIMGVFADLYNIGVTPRLPDILPASATYSSKPTTDPKPVATSAGGDEEGAEATGKNEQEQDRAAGEDETAAAGGFMTKVRQSNTEHIYGLIGGAVLWFCAARWTSVGARLRGNRRLQLAMTEMFKPEKSLWEYITLK